MCADGIGEIANPSPPGVAIRARKVNAGPKDARTSSNVRILILRGFSLGQGELAKPAAALFLNIVILTPDGKRRCYSMDANFCSAHKSASG
jgi:hypothetical protein